MSPDSAWLVVVDMQECFADAESPWHVPGYDRIVPTVTELLDRFGQRTLLTRFVSDEHPPGAWAEYYRRWPTMLRPPDDGCWDLTVPVPDGATVATRTTFSKWGERTDLEIPQGSPLVVCGVATEACVLATVVDAAERGRKVLVVADACRGTTAELHRSTLQVLASFTPLVEVVASTDVLAGSSPRRGQQSSVPDGTSPDSR